MRVRQESGNWLEFNRIENVERVYKILRDYLGADVSNTISSSGSSSSSGSRSSSSSHPSPLVQIHLGKRIKFH